MTKITTVSKKMLSLIMALLMIGSAVAFSASAATEVPKPVCSINEANNAIIVAPITVDEGEVAIAISPNEGIEMIPVADGSTRFQGVKGGVTYTITAIVTLNGEVKGTSTETVKLLKTQAVPSAPVCEKRTATSLKISKVAGCEYKAEGPDEEGNTVIISDWGDTVLFENLKPETFYVIYARKAAVKNEYYASDAVSLSVKTLKAGNAVAVAKPVLEDKTNTTITVKAEAGVEYSIDGGKTWQTSGDFKNLKASTSYTIVAREAFDASVQEANPMSEGLTVITNSRASYEASLTRCTFKAQDGKRYANENVKITVTGDAPADLNTVQYGDTMYAPASFEAAGTKADFAGTTKVGTGTFLPGEANADKTVVVTVTYNKLKYVGDGWAQVGTVTEKYTVKIGPVNNTMTKIKEGLETVLNFLLNTVPKFISDALKSDIWGKIFDLIGKLSK
ncbi:MAG: hypothetical protein ACI4JG_09175 [Acutalibacteraceae bacterium]